jgi:hypothetical protein
MQKIRGIWSNLSSRINEMSVKKFIFLVCILSGFEYLAALVTWHTVSEIESWLHIVAIFLNIIFVLIFFRRKFIATFCVISLSGFLIGPQIYWGVKYLLIDAEIKSIISYMNTYKKDHGLYPQNLKTYVWEYPFVQKHIQDFKVDGLEYQITYCIATQSTSHWYSSQTGWGHYPD